MTEDIIAWVTKWWWLILLVDVVLMKILNSTTQHFSDSKGVVKICLFLVDLLDIVKTTPAPKRGGQ